MRRVNKTAYRRRAITGIGGLAVALLSSDLLALTQPVARPQARRIISIGGAITEILYALNAGGEIVAVDTTSNFPESVQKLPNVGYARALSAEGILALAPTQIITSEDAGPPAVLRQLSASGVPLAMVTAHHRFEGVLDRIREISVLTGRQSEAATLTRSLQEEWAQVRKRVQRRAAQSDNKPVRLVFILAHAPNQVMVAGRDTAAHAVLEYAGASNAVIPAGTGGTGGFSGYKPLTPEAMIAARPDIILVTDQGVKAAGGMDAILQLPGVAQTPAGRQRRVISLEAMLLLGFGPRLPAAIGMLDEAIVKVMRA